MDKKSIHRVNPIILMPRADIKRMRREETGRSLTEMLGMLAIMGILSVAGIALYHSAMNKHRANELIYEAQKRATTVAMQITAGRDTLSIGEFTNPTGYVFGVEKNPDDIHQFNITLNAVPDDICEQMKIAVGEGGIIRKISDDCREITFNNDLSRTRYASEISTQAECVSGGNKWCAFGDNGADGKCTEQGAGCCDRAEYNIQCQSCAPDTGAVSDKEDAPPCDFDGDGLNDSFCNSGICPKPEIDVGKECTTNDDCGGVGSGYYCKINYDANINLNGISDTSNTDCFKKLKGTCAILGKPMRLSGTQKALLTKNFSASTIIGPGAWFNWWSANNWCKAQGKHLVDVSEIACYRKNNNALIQTANKWAWCCREGAACQQESWNTTLWNGKEILPGKEAEVAKFSKELIALRKIAGATGFWTNSSYNVASENSCQVFIASSTNGRVSNGRRYSTLYNALCE